MNYATSGTDIKFIKTDIYNNNYESFSFFQKATICTDTVVEESDKEKIK